MTSVAPEWFLSLRALLTTNPPPFLASPATMGFRVGADEFCCDASGREVSARAVTTWLIAPKELFAELYQGITTPQEACAAGALQLQGDPDTLCAVSVLFERLGRL